MLYHVLLSFYLFTISSCSLDVETNYLEEDKNLDVCLQNIVGQIQETELKIVVTAVNFKSSGDTATLSKINSALYISRSFYWPENSIKNELYIINSNDYAEFENGIELLKKDFYWNPRAKFIIHIESLSQHLQVLSALLFNNNIFNVSLLSQVEDDHEIYTFNPVLDSCGKPAVKTLEPIIRCSKFSKSINIFNIKKPRSLRGCHFKLVTHSFWPFVNFNKTLNNAIGLTELSLQVWYEVTGIFAELVEYDQSENFGRVTENYTLTGMLSWIADNKVEGAIGGYDITLGRAKALDYSYPYTIDHSKAIVARANMLTNWGAVFIQFNWYTTVIISMFITFFGYAVVNYSIFEKRKKDVSRSILIVFGYVCGNMRIKYIKTDSPLRIIICCLLLFVFFLTFLIQAYLSSATTHPIRSRQVKHLQEVLAKYTPLRSWTWQTAFDTKAPLDCGTVIDCLTKVKEKNKKLYTVIAEISYTSHAWKFTDRDGQSLLFQIEEPIRRMYRGAYFRRGTTILDAYTKLIQSYTENGLATYSFYALLYKDRLEHIMRKNVEVGPDAETLSDLMEIFIVLLAGYMLSTITFVYECRSMIRQIFRFNQQNNFMYYN